MTSPFFGVPLNRHIVIHYVVRHLDGMGIAVCGILSNCAFTEEFIPLHNAGEAIIRSGPF